MALTFVDEVRTVARNKRLVVTQCTFDSSYATGGESLTPADLGLTTIDFLAAQTDGTRAFLWDKTNSKLKAYDASGAEIANATNLSAVVIRVMAIGNT